jgi:hypothetical protein
MGASTPPVGQPEVLARYQCDEGTRKLVGQRIGGTVALSDVPAGGDGKVYLVERHLASMKELEAVIADYRQLAAALGRPPMAADWICR